MFVVDLMKWYADCTDSTATELLSRLIVENLREILKEDFVISSNLRKDLSPSMFDELQALRKKFDSVDLSDAEPLQFTECEL